MRLTPQQWLNTIFTSYLKKHQVPESESSHIQDFLNQHPKIKLSTRTSYKSIKTKAELWTIQLNEKNKNLTESGATRKVHQVTPELSFVQLLDQTARNWEGKHMGHCVASYTDDKQIYSLRDPDHIPHCTLEFHEGSIIQIRGKSNGPVAPDYVDPLFEVFKTIDHKINASGINALGYVLVDQAQKNFFDAYFEGMKYKPIYQHTYLYLGNQLKMINPFPLPHLDARTYNLFIDYSICPEVIPLMVGYKILSERDAFDIACRKGYVEILPALIKYHTERNKPIFLANHIFATHQMTAKTLAAIKFLINHEEIFTTKIEQFMMGVMNNQNLAVFELMLKKGIPFLKKSTINTLFNTLCWNVDIPMLELILKHPHPFSQDDLELLMSNFCRHGDYNMVINFYGKIPLPEAKLNLVIKEIVKTWKYPAEETNPTNPLLDFLVNQSIFYRNNKRFLDLIL